jgi:prepilin-type processing-associated H-X9-DG protein
MSRKREIPGRDTKEFTSAKTALIAFALLILFSSSAMATEDIYKQGIIALNGTGVSIYGGSLIMNSNRITNMATPTANSDAATKDYVDMQIALGGGITIPIANVTNLISSYQCPGTDKLMNMTIGTNGITGACSTDLAGGGTNASAGGIADYIAKFTNTTNLGNSIIFENGANIGIGTALPTYKLHVIGTLSASIDASNITSGTIASARLSGSYTGITGVGTITAGAWQATPIIQQYLGGITLPAGNISAGTIGSGVTWNGNPIIQTYLGGITIPVANTTGEFPQSRMSITIPIANATGTVPQNRLSITGLEIANTTGEFPQSRMSITIPIANATGTLLQSRMSITLPFANLTGMPFNLTGSGTAGYVPYFSNATNLLNSVIYQNGTSIGIGTTSPVGSLSVNGNIITIGGVDNNPSTFYKLGNDDLRIENWGRTTDTGAVNINYNGYQGGTTVFRDFGVYNGKNTNILFVDGSTGNVGINITSPTSTLNVVGTVNVTSAGSGIIVDGNGNVIIKLG